MAIVFGYRWNASNSLSAELEASEKKAKKTLDVVKAAQEKWRKSSKWGDLKQEAARVNQVHPYRKAWLSVLGEILKVVPATNNGLSTNDLAKEQSKLWVYEIQMNREDRVEKLARKTPRKGARKRGQARFDSWTRSVLLAKLGVMIVSRGEVSADAARIDAAVVSKLRDRLQGLAKSMGLDSGKTTVKPEIKYRYVDVRDPEMYFGDQSPPQDRGKFFLRVVEVEFPLNNAPATKAKKKP